MLEVIARCENIECNHEFRYVVKNNHCKAECPKCYTKTHQYEVLKDYSEFPWNKEE